MKFSERQEEIKIDPAPAENSPSLWVQGSAADYRDFSGPVHR